MKISRPTKVTIAAITPVRGSSTKPKLIVVEPTVSHGISKGVWLLGPMPHASLNAQSAKPHDPSMATIATPAARRPHFMQLVMAAANSGNKAIKAKLVVLILP